MFSISPEEKRIHLLYDADADLWHPQSIFRLYLLPGNIRHRLPSNERQFTDSFHLGISRQSDTFG